MCRDVGDGVLSSPGTYVVSSLLPQPGQRAAHVAFPDRSDLHEELLSEPVPCLGRSRGFHLWLLTVIVGSLIQSVDCQGGQLLLGQAHETAIGTGALDEGA